jgi:nitroreductase
MSIEKAISERKSIRTFTHHPISLSDIAQLMWAAQGIAHQHSLRSTSLFRKNSINLSFVFVENRLFRQIWRRPTRKIGTWV